MKCTEGIHLPEPLESSIGNIERGAITNFYGSPGVGKTNICILAALECVKSGGRVAYIDTEGGLSPERIMQISGGNESIFNRIVLIEPKTFQEQGVVIKNVEKEDFDMIIVDSSVALYRLHYADPSNETLEANRELSVQLSVLSNIARKKGIPVVITAHTFLNRDTGENRVIGGDTIKYWSKSIFFIERTSKMSERKITIVKHRSRPEGISAKFAITQEGIKPVSGIKLF